MKNAIFLVGLLCLISSCGIEENEIAETNSITLEMLQEQLDQEAKQNYLDFLESEKGQELIGDVLQAKGGGPSGKAPCDCFYEIHDVDIDNGEEEYLWQIRSTASCPEFATGLSCNYFNGSYNSMHPDCVTVILPQCVDEQVQAGNSYDFNCAVNRNTSFDVNFRATGVNPASCFPVSIGATSIELRIVCCETTILPIGTNWCGDLPRCHRTPKFTMQLGPGENLISEMVQLVGCAGCYPVLVP